MEKILEHADALGSAIAATETFTRFKAARAAFLADDMAQQMLKDFESQHSKVQKLLSETRPVEPEDKRKLETLRQAVDLNLVIREFRGAELAFMSLLMEVQDRIQRPLGLEASAPGADSHAEPGS